LTSDDGLRDYDFDEAKIGLITCDKYRMYRRYIPQVKGWWWTCTPWSTKSGANGEYVRCVCELGALGSVSADSGNIGVRPICSLQYDTLVSVEDEDTE
ncbi:MAG: hypothetical protein RSB98_02975, partial [Raoultibacter sp.]